MTPILFVLAGISLMLTPVIITQLQNLEQARAARDYSAQVLQMKEEILRQERDQASAWNASTSIPIAGDPWTSDADHGDPDYQAYLRQLDVVPVMARIRVPAAQIDLPIYHGTDEQTLARGAGHLFGTSLPVGGPGTHAVITGHTGITSATLFDNLIDVRDGDLMAVDVLNETLVYRVTQIQTVLPHETESLAREAGLDQLTLITCTPYGINTHRLLVTGERISDTSLPTRDVGFIWQPWMIQALVLSAVLVALIFLVWIYRHRKERR
ncbi:fimbria-associated protein [Corynebacterium humireducens NBRC 106098 = DSM 45392]|uniref:Fimbria-associated protein n=1 Tax=Corynebacterium humireducens NBRC 106098 = DSM 45392 TaxID=1223515 RepID=A0A0B5DBE9_9CORY|nr:class C sortase [Corynebacterium humireducens]AJE34277.1 fimbria-associated protein [Corynebacterium humireducens NBRC 106098 = DSM 45392]